MIFLAQCTIAFCDLVLCTLYNVLLVWWAMVASCTTVHCTIAPLHYCAVYVVLLGIRTLYQEFVPLSISASEQIPFLISSSQEALHWDSGRQDVLAVDQASRQALHRITRSIRSAHQGQDRRRYNWAQDRYSTGSHEVSGVLIKAKAVNWASESLGALIELRYQGTLPVLGDQPDCIS